MLLEEDPASLIYETTKHFNINPDKTAIARIHESLATLGQARDLRTREAEGALKKLSRTHTMLASQHAETTAAHSSASHATKIVELDTQKFRIAKAASDLEIDAERCEAELEALKARLQALELQGVEGDETARAKREEQDPTVLRLKIYRGLGIDAERDESGCYSKAVIRNSRAGDVHVVTMDPKFSRFFYANFFWGKM